MFAPLFVYSYLTATVASAKSHVRSERGASFTEYVVLIGAVVVVVAAGVTLLGTKITAKINALAL